MKAVMKEQVSLRILPKRDAQCVEEMFNFLKKNNMSKVRTWVGIIEKTLYLDSAE